MQIGPILRVAGKTAKMAAKYGPQAKLAWDNGGKKGSVAAAKRAVTLNARRKAMRHAAGLVDGSVLKVAPEGRTVYVVFTGERSVASYPKQDVPLGILLEHADLTKRVVPKP